MILALYSNQALSETKHITQQVLSVIGTESPKIGYISSAPDPERKYYNSVKSYYEQFGANLGNYNDLEDGYNEDSLETTFSSDAIHLTGGDTFRFLSAVKKRSIGDRLIDFARNKGALIGVSAGAILLGPTIESSFLCGDVNADNLEDLSGLNLYSFLFLPHADQIMDLKNKARILAEKHSTPVISINDDQAILVTDSSIKIISGAMIHPSK